jgi:AcrR family transcriptional regulator
MSPAGRRPGVQDTRAAIIAAARAEFSDRGYTGATIRHVATRAGVDPALVHHYFTDKAGLFVASLDLPADPRQVQDQARHGGLDGSRIVERFLAQWEDGTGEPGQPFVTLTQAMSSSPQVATAVREFLTERVWGNVPAADATETRARTALVSAHLLGLAWARYVVRMEPLASAPRAQVAAWAGPAIEAYITGGPPAGAGTTQDPNSE